MTWNRKAMAMRYLIVSIALVFVAAGSGLLAQPLIQDAIQFEQPDRIVLRIPDHESLTGIIKIQEQFEDGLRGWAGPLQGRPGSFALLSDSGRLFARVHVRDRVYLYEPGNGAHRVTSLESPPFSCAAQQSASQLGAGAVSAPAIAGPCDHLTARPSDPCYAAEQAMAAAAAAAGLNSCPRFHWAATHPVEIRLLVLYTPTVEAAHPSHIIRQEVYFSILETNASFLVSGIPASVRMARRGRERTGCLFRSDNDETGILVDDFKALLTTMPDVLQKRDQCGADVVVLLTEVTNHASGMACVMKARTAAFAPYAMAIVRFNSMVHHYTFTHEIGHLMGGGHDRSQNELADGCRTGMCSESAGWHFIHAGLRYKTMMAYGGEKSLHFSDPRIQFEGGPRTGASNANNAQTLRRTVATVSQFRP